MASGIAHISLGAMNMLAEIVDGNIVTPSAFVLALFVSADTDDALQDADDLAAVEALSSTAEVTDGSYARIVLDDTDIGATTIDDSGNTASFDIADQTWSSLAGGDSITKLCIFYDADTAAGTDSDLRHVAQYDFSVTTNGGNVTAQTPSGLWSASNA